METQKYEFSSTLSESALKRLAFRFEKVHPTFQAQAFVDACKAAQLEEIAFKARVNLIAEKLALFLPNNFPVALETLYKVLGPELEQATFTSPDAFMHLPLAQYVAQYGLKQPQIAIPFLKELTKRFSAEFAIRPFLEQAPEPMLEYLKIWAEDSNFHVRRLVSEGTRPRLPWASQLTCFKENYQPVLALLKSLAKDPHPYVRKSVANHLNDLSKNTPALLIKTLEDWTRTFGEDILPLKRHALRTLLKKGDQQALELIGYEKNIDLEIGALSLDKTRFTIPDRLKFEATICSKEAKPKPLMIDYVIGFVKKNGQRSEKVFKGKKMLLKPREQLTFEGQQVFKQLSTRRLYAGEHSICLQINGCRYGTTFFELKQQSLDS
jgi:3-methyladenine DNA glycosylase AlkC